VSISGATRRTPPIAQSGESSAARQARSYTRSEAPHSAVLHLATHGIESRSGCASGGTRGLSLRAESPPSDPAASTALLFAAPATTAGDSADDGLLGGLEIAALDLSGVQWAVLAACSTAAGSTHAYEGLYGLARAFRLAGARTVFLSLWPVDDAATAELMRAFYAGLLGPRKLSPPAALRQAQRHVRSDPRWRAPYYWAAFQLQGVWAADPPH
jgi:CHAT domain-containing protein